MRRMKRRFYTDDLENVAEDLVFEQVEALLDAQPGGFCTCHICLQDLAAIVLNQIPPLYCCSLLEKNSPNETFARRIAETRARVAEVLPRAMALVRSHDNH